MREMTAGMALAGRVGHRVHDLASGAAELLVPFFLVGIGLHVDLSAFQNQSTMVLATVILIAAVVSKFVGCGIASLGMGKAEAMRIGTYPISIVPDQDCCTLFTPRNPLTRARLADVEAAERTLPLRRVPDGTVRCRSDVVRGCAVRDRVRLQCGLGSDARRRGRGLRRGSAGFDCSGAQGWIGRWR